MVQRRVHVEVVLLELHPVDRRVGVVRVPEDEEQHEAYHEQPQKRHTNLLTHRKPVVTLLQLALQASQLFRLLSFIQIRQLVLGLHTEAIGLIFRLDLRVKVLHLSQELLFFRLCHVVLFPTLRNYVCLRVAHAVVHSPPLAALARQPPAARRHRRLCRRRGPVCLVHHSGVGRRHPAHPPNFVSRRVSGILCIPHRRRLRAARIPEGQVSGRLRLRGHAVRINAVVDACRFVHLHRVVVERAIAVSVDRRSL